MGLLIPNPRRKAPFIPDWCGERTVTPLHPHPPDAGDGGAEGAGPGGGRPPGAEAGGAPGYPPGAPVGARLAYAFWCLFFEGGGRVPMGRFILNFLGGSNRSCGGFNFCQFLDTPIFTEVCCVVLLRCHSSPISQFVFVAKNTGPDRGRSRLRNKILRMEIPKVM